VKEIEKDPRLEGFHELPGEKCRHLRRDRGSKWVGACPPAVCQWGLVAIALSASSATDRTSGSGSLRADRTASTAPGAEGPIAFNAVTASCRWSDRSLVASRLMSNGAAANVEDVRKRVGR
jgi:hypothetical protein